MTGSASPPIAPPPARPRWPLWLAFFIVLLIGGAALGLYIRSQRIREWEWAKIALPKRMARVPAPWSAATLAARLRKNHKIRDAGAFEEAAAQVGLQNVAVGSYFLPEMAGPLDLAQAFKAGPTHEEVTFPEGFTAAQIAARLQKHGFVNAAAVEKAAYPVGKAPQLEGKLFPSTYLLPLRASGPALIGTLTAQWQSEMKKLPRPFPLVGTQRLTEMQVVTLASLVEREAASAKEMPLIAGILIGRLRHPMRLQVDASIQYARLLAQQGHKNRLDFDDLKIDSPYNSYLNDGLPPTPICNPGAAALRAAARPATTTALFYVYSPVLKHHLYADTFEQHKHNIAVVRQQRAALENAATTTGNAAADAAIGQAKE